MEYAEDDYLMISGIQHFRFCKRQWALIHIEQQWAENEHTVIGELMHKKAHDPYLTEKRRDTIIARALPVASREMGVTGECDVVEFHRCEDGIRLHGHRGNFSVYPIEYKKGKPKITEEDKLQLAAQAMCLEEMFSTQIPEGALFYGETKRREIVEKKSRFIATVRLVESEEEALSCLEALRKKYWDARHNCFVYIIGENQETVRCSDDGEPSGTAGRPMLDVVQGAGLRNVLVVVTRYFGGTLLGTGGLVRAYSQAVQEGLANSVLIDEICGVRLLIETDYNGIGKIQYLLGQRGIPILESEYTDQVKIRVLVPKTEVDRLCAEITEGTNGKAKLEKEEELYFAQNDGELIFGDALTQYKNLEAEELG